MFRKCEMEQCQGGESPSRVLFFTVLSVLLLLTGCGGGRGGSTEPPAIPDLTGYWAGSWRGSDPNLGEVTGTWEAELTQSLTRVTGNATLMGDVDCMDGTVTGASTGDSVVGTKPHLSRLRNRT
jgi:hypothetical protein